MLNWDDPLAAPAESGPQAPVSESIPPAPETAPAAKGAGSTPSEQAGPAVPAARDLRPVNPDDKRVINGMTDINQLAPFKYPWAWEYFLNANKNHWTPLDISMAQDVHDYHHKLTLEERHVYENVLSYLTTSDIFSITARPILRIARMSDVVRYDSTFSYTWRSSSVSLW